MKNWVTNLNRKSAKQTDTIKMKIQYFHIFSLVLFMVFTGVFVGGNSGKTDDYFCVEPEYIDHGLLLQLVNDIRQQGCNCGDDYFAATTPVTWNNALEQASLAHCDDMHENNFFSHVSSNGSNLGDRVKKSGYIWSVCGENIGKGYIGEEDVVSGWLSSPGHCKNLMNPVFKEMGVARNGEYWTQVFATQY
jgi:hypothetical protein